MPPEPDPEAASLEVEEPAVDEPEPKAKPAEEPAAGHQRKGGYQRRIERLERQNQQLLEALNRGATPATPVAEKTPEQKAAAQAAEQFDRIVDQRIAQRDAEREQRSQVDSFAKRAAEARSKHEDWDDAISDLNVPTNSPLGQALLTSEQGPEIMYSLATNQAELARISALPPFAQAREIGRMEAKLASGAAPLTPVTAKRPPVPPSSVGGNSPKPTRSLETLPISEYKKAHRSGRR